MDIDIVRLINKALSDEDIQKILGGDAKIIKYAELGQLYDIDQLLKMRRTTALYFTRTDQTEDTGQPS